MLLFGPPEDLRFCQLQASCRKLRAPMGGRQGAHLGGKASEGWIVQGEIRGMSIKPGKNVQAVA